MLKATAKAVLAAVVGVGVIATGIHFAAKFMKARAAEKSTDFRPTREFWYGGRFYTQNRSLAKKLKLVAEHQINFNGNVEKIWSIDGTLMSNYITLCKIYKALFEARRDGNLIEIMRLGKIEKKLRTTIETEVNSISTPDL